MTARPTSRGASDRQAARRERRRHHRCRVVLVSLSVIDKITGAGVVQFSPANTSRRFDTYADKGLYFRTAPSDVLQGPVLGNLVARGRQQERRHPGPPGLLRRGPGRPGREDVSRPSGGNVAAKDALRRRRGELHRRGQQGRGGQARRHRPDRVRRDQEDHPGADRQGHRSAGQQIYFVDGNTADYSKDFPKGTLKGVKGPTRVPSSTRLQGAAAEDRTRSSRTSPTVPSPTTPRS